MLPWTEDNKTKPLTEDEITLYLSLICQVNAIGRIECNLRAIEDFMHVKDPPKAFVKKIVDVLTAIFCRCNNHFDYIEIMPSSKTPQSIKLTINDPLYLSVTEGNWSPEGADGGYFTITPEDVYVIAKNTTTYVAFSTTLMMFLHLRGKMFAHKYINSQNMEKMGFAISVGLDEIEGEVRLKRQSVINYLQFLEKIGLILHQRGEKGKYSTYVYPSDQYLMESVLTPRTRPEWTKVKGYRGPM